MNNSVSKIKMTNKFDELFASANGSTGDVRDVDLMELHDFQNHPFHVVDDEKMKQLVESIGEYGIFTPGIARPRREGGYELISGHRRKRAAEIAGFLTMPVIVREMTDDEAVITMVDANLQREKILPSEKAFAYKMKLEAMSHQGKRDSETSRQVVEKLVSADVVGKESGDSGRQIQRYIRLTALHRDFLEMVDEKVLKFNPAVEISYLDADDQDLLLDEMDTTNVVPSLMQAREIKKLAQEGGYTREAVRAILYAAKVPERRITLGQDRLCMYFPSGYSNKEIERVIYGLLDSWKQGQEGQM